MRKYWLLLFTCLYVHATSAQTGKVQGKVTDSAAMPVAGAAIRLLNTETETFSNALGQFVLELSPGKYTLEISARGYASKMIDIAVVASGIVDADVVLELNWLSLGEVTVQSDRREQRELRTAAATSSFQQKDIQAYRLWELKDISSLVPGLYSANPGDGRNVTTIRGIGTTSYDPAVVTYIDGVCQFNLDTYIAQLIDAEKIEVLRGPQGTLFGRNAMGGVIQVTTRKPGNQTKVFTELHAGNYGLLRSTASVRLPILKDRLFAGLTWQQHRRDGYYRNSFNGKDFDGISQQMGNLTLRYVGAGRWSANFNAKGQFTRNEGAFPLNGSLEAALEEPFVLSQNAVAAMRDKGLNASLAVIRSGRSVRLEMNTAWQMNQRIYDGALDGDFSPLDIVSIFNDYGSRFNRVRTWTQELRLSSTPSSTGKITWTAGSFTFMSENPVRQATRFGKDAGLFGIPDKNFALIQQNAADGLGTAVFGQASYSLSNQVSLVLGMRYDREQRVLSVRGEYEKGDAIRFVTRTDTSAKGQYHAFSPKAGLNFQLSDLCLIYAQYSRGFRAGGLTTLGSDPSQPPLSSYNPEYSDNFELGIKGKGSEGNLQYRLFASYTLASQVQVPTLILPDAITITRNAGRMRSIAVESDLEWKPVKGLSLVSRIGVTDARFTALTLSQNGQELNLAGNRQIFTPSHTAVHVAEFMTPISRKQEWKLEARLEWVSTGRQYFDLANQIQQPDYSMLHARAGISGRQWSLFVWGRNLTDRTYVAYAYDFGAVHLGGPRTWGLTLSFTK